MSLEIWNAPAKLVIVMVSQTLIDYLVFDSFGTAQISDKPNHDYVMTAGLCVLMFILNDLIVPRMGLADTRKERMAKAKGKEAKKEEPHVLYNIVFSLLAYGAFLVVLVNKGGHAYSPLHCHHEGEEFVLKCEYAQVGIKTQLWNEFFYLIVMVFSLGPLRVFLKVKEGKTSLDKIIEDFDEDRTQFHNMARRSQDGILPTSGAPRTRVNAASEETEQTEYH